MNYREFKNIVENFPVILMSSMNGIFSNLKTQQRQLNRWEKKGLIIRLKRGLYVLNKHDRKVNPSKVHIANSLYSASYVSTEYALGYYDLIPEKVEDVTSITTKNTASFTNDLGTFSYRHLKTSLFFGFTVIKDENSFPVRIAEPEKAMLDFIYLNLQDFKNASKDIFDLSYRFQNLEIFKKGKLKEFAKRYDNKQVSKVIIKLLEFIEEEK